jgi:TatD DNase family protein
MVTICTRLSHEPRVRAIAEAYDGVFYAAGTHPMSAAEEPMATVDELVRLARHPKFVGIGESGLDYHYTAETKAVQQESLAVHIEAARRTGLPLIIHARDADEDMARILTEEYRAGAFSCVMHCFSSGAALAEAALDLGFYLSMSGIAAFPKSRELRAIFAAAPLERILVETDSPYLAPPPFRGKRNEPAHVIHTARVGAEIFGLDYPAFAAATEANFDRLFTKAARASRAA